MKIFASSFFSSLLSTTFLFTSLLSPQYILSRTEIPTSIKEKFNAAEFKERPIKQSSKEKHNKPEKGKPKLTGVYKEKLDTKNALNEQGLKFPQFNQSLIRSTEKQPLYDRIYTRPTFQQETLEFRKAKKQIESLYNKNQAFLNYDVNASPRIPKVVHQIWLGSAVPKKFVSWMSSWANMQGWEYKLWTDLDVEQFPMYNRKLYDNAKSFGEKADILRYEILFNEGGVYVDVDFENINSEIFNLLNRSFDFYAGLEPMEHRQPIPSPIIGNAILASIPGHPFLEKVILDMDNHYNDHEGEWAVVSTGPVYLTKKFHDYNQSKDDLQNIILPPTFLFPVTFTEVRENLKNNLNKFIKPETAAIHYWSSSWIEEDQRQQSNAKTMPITNQKITKSRRWK